MISQFRTLEAFIAILILALFILFSIKFSVPQNLNVIKFNTLKNLNQQNEILRKYVYENNTQEIKKFLFSINPNFEYEVQICDFECKPIKFEKNVIAIEYYFSNYLNNYKPKTLIVYVLQS